MRYTKQELNWVREQFQELSREAKKEHKIRKIRQILLKEMGLTADQAKKVIQVIRE